LCDIGEKFEQAEARRMGRQAVTEAVATYRELLGRMK
jgi:hypothetical protein